MITLKNNTTNTECIVTPTIFPDGTSQVWKLPEHVLITDSIASRTYTIIWHFESEVELFQVLQLTGLIMKYNRAAPHLIVPFLPYGRQDKVVSNDSTFALKVFKKIVSDWFTDVITYDAHSSLDESIVSLYVNNQIDKAITSSQCDLVCFPDKGAANRKYDIGSLPSFNLDKKRNQSTGVIEGLVCSLPLNLTDKTILIVDDLCDGGRTFIEAAKLLYSMGAKSVDLYVTHGIFSQGIHVLTELGKIRNIYTTDSILRNTKLAESHKNLTVFKLEL